MNLGRKGQSKGLKRKPAPRFWPIHRKEFVWVIKPSPGAHRIENCLPLAVALRDVLRYAKTRKEAKTIVSSGKIQVNGKLVREDDLPIGLMDVISIEDISKHFCVLPSNKGLLLALIDKKQAEFKLCRIEDKTVVSKDRVQLNLHDGSNISVKNAETEKSEISYETLDTLKVSIPERQILEYVKMEEGGFAIITGGKNTGKHGKIVEIEKARGKKRRNSLATIEDKDGNRFQTILGFLFATGEEQLLMKLEPD